MGSLEVASLFSEYDIVGLQKVASSSSSSLVLLLFEVEMGDKLQKETCSLSLFLFLFLIVFFFLFSSFVFIHNRLTSASEGKRGMKNAWTAREPHITR
jgi:hypothetical protein